VARVLGVGPASTVVDLAAGTGKLTRLLVGLAARVIAVDPSETMLAALRARLPSVEARAGTAEAIPLADGSADAVFVGQAFHWFRAEEACREIARVLAPGGGVALLWNRARWRDAEPAWVPAVRALLAPHREAAGEFPSGDDRWRRALEARFEPLAREEYEHVHRVAPDDLVALIGSWSWIANVPQPERGDLLARVRDLVGDSPEIALPYRTEVFWTRRAILP
jgi:SAM-dependent methyltransferase